MDQERLKRIDELLQQAMELEGEALAEFLDRACAGDAELRREVAGMLSSEVATGEILKHSPAADSRRKARADALREGELVSHYRIESRIGRGGMGEVYLARDERLQRLVALKALPAEFTADADRVRRFEQEAIAASRLNHPNIITIFEIVQTGEAHFIAAEYVEGRTLRQRMESGPMAWPEALEIAVQIASALAAAHEAGIVHRDIKPENVMVRPDDLVKVLDFGLAKLTGSDATVQGAGDPGQAPAIESYAPDDQPTQWRLSGRVRTQPGRMMGTVGYMSPEQLRGGVVDGRSDLFSLGVVLYEMIAGRAPFTGAGQAEVIKAILEQEPAALGPAAAPRELRRIIARALRKDPALRYAATARMLDDLRTARRWLRWLKWRGGVLKAAAMILVVFLIGAMVWLWRHDWKPLLPVRPVSVTTALADGKIYEEAAISPDGRLAAYTIFVGGNRGLWVRDLTDGSERMLVPPALGYDCQFPTFTADGVNLYFLARRQSEEATALYQVPVSGGAPQRVLDRVDGPVAFAPYGRRFVFMREDRGAETTRAVQRRRQTALFIANLDGSDARPLVTRQEPDRIFSSRAAWSPDGQRVAFAAGAAGREARYQVFQIALDTGLETPLSSRGWQNVEDLVWMRDNSGLALIAGDADRSHWQVWFLSLASGEQSRLTSDSVNYTSLSATADSRMLFAVQYQDQFSLWTMPVNESRLIRQIMMGEDAGHNGIIWTLGGQILYAVVAQSHQQLWVTDVDGQNNRLFTSDAADSDGPSLPPDDRYLVYCSRGGAGGNTNIWRRELASGQLQQLSRGRLDVDPECSPDGRWVVYVSWDQSRKASVWKVPLAGGAAVELAAEITENPSPAISPDGRRLAYYRNEGHRKWIDIISLDNHRLLRSIEVRERFYLLEWARDGRALIYAESAGRVTNLYRLPLTGGPPKLITDFSSHAIVWFATSRDGARMALSRYLHKRELVRIANFR